MARVKSDLNFAIHKKFKEKGFFNGPPAAPLAVDIAERFIDKGVIVSTRGLDHAKRHPRLILRSEIAGLAGRSMF